MVGVNELKEIAIKCGTPSYIFDTDELCARIDAMQADSRMWSYSVLCNEGQSVSYKRA